MIYKGHTNSVIQQSTGHSSVQTNDTLRFIYVGHPHASGLLSFVHTTLQLLQLFSSSPPAQLATAVCRQLVTRICKLHLRFDFVTTHHQRKEHEAYAGSAAAS